MNERAAAASRKSGLQDGLLPIWHVDAERALFVGPLGYNAPHAHSVPVMLAGLYGAFRLRIAGGSWQRCQTAVLPAGLVYEFDIEGHPLAVLYLEPSAGNVFTLAPFVTNAEEQDGGLFGHSAIVETFRELYERRESAAWCHVALDELLGYSGPRARCAMDQRVAHAVSRLQLADDLDASAAQTALTVGLSSSRFQHLFAAEVGVPFRRYRSWLRLRRAIGEIVSGSTFTAAAHSAGFADQAHFSRAFRQAFGATASPSLRKVRRSDS